MSNEIKDDYRLDNGVKAKYGSRVGFPGLE
jgi:hypothetical protein